MAADAVLERWRNASERKDNSAASIRSPRGNHRSDGRPGTPDRDLEAKLQREAPAILRWMIEGCLDWQRNGLVRPPVVAEATAEYFEAHDAIGRWLEERCILDPSLAVKPGILLADCRTWAGENGEAVPSSSQFRSAMERVPGVRYVKVEGLHWVKGVGLKRKGRDGEGSFR